jgi:hypothetical protein
VAAYLDVGSNLGRVTISSDGGGTWTPQETPRQWWAVAMSAAGTKVVAAVFGGSIFTYNSLGLTTTPGPAGSLRGGQYSAVELQYIGDGQFLPLSSVGALIAQ